MATMKAARGIAAPVRMQDKGRPMTLDGRPPRVRCAVRVLIARALPVIVVLLLAAGTTAGVAYSRGWHFSPFGGTDGGMLACLAGADSASAVADHTSLSRALVTLPALAPYETLSARPPLPRTAGFSWPATIASPPCPRCCSTGPMALVSRSRPSETAALPGWRCRSGAS